MSAETANSTPAAVMMTITEIAARDGVSKPTVSVAVKKLIASGLEVERDARGRVARVNVAQYDHLREKFGNAIRAQAPPAPPAQHDTLPLAPDALDDSLIAAQTRRAHIEAERAALRLAEDQGDLVRKAGLLDAVSDAGVTIARIIDRLPQAADDLAAAVGRDGPHGARRALKEIAQKMREEIATALSAIAGEAPEFEGPQDQTQDQQEVGAVW